MTGGTITGLLSAFGLLTYLDGSDLPTFCLYQVIDGNSVLIYSGSEFTFSIIDPNPGQTQIYTLTICGDCPSDPFTLIIPGVFTLEQPVCADMAFEQPVCADTTFDTAPVCADFTRETPCA
jgi:hypothetical protein